MPKKTWEKGGPSPNPNGRPRKTKEQLVTDQEIKNIGKNYTMDSLHFLHRVMNSNNETMQTKLKAAIKLSDIGIAFIVQDERQKHRMEAKEDIVEDKDDDRQPGVVVSFTAVDK